MGDSNDQTSVTDGQDKGDSVLDEWGMNCRDMGEHGPASETVGVRDMGDTEAAGSVDALENDVSYR